MSEAATSVAFYDIIRCFTKLEKNKLKMKALSAMIDTIIIQPALISSLFGVSIIKLAIAIFSREYQVIFLIIK